MAYAISSRDYLRRAEERLEEGTPPALFYAALELRCGVEARMKEYLDVWDHISKKKKKGWRIAELGSNLEQAFRLGSRVVRWAVSDRGTNELIVCLYHTPVLQTLQGRAQRFGDYLHSQKKFRPDNDLWWSTLRNELGEARTELEFANTGTLLGPPLLKKSTGKVDMKLEILPGEDPRQAASLVAGREVLIDVSYPRTLPDRLEKEAMVWRRVS